MNRLLTDFATGNTGIEDLNTHLFRSHFDVGVFFKSIQNILTAEITRAFGLQLNTFGVFQLPGKPYRQCPDIFIAGIMIKFHRQHTPCRIGQSDIVFFGGTPECIHPARLQLKNKVGSTVVLLCILQFTFQFRNAVGLLLGKQIFVPGCEKLFCYTQRPIIDAKINIIPYQGKGIAEFI